MAEKLNICYVTVLDVDINGLLARKFVNLEDLLDSSLPCAPGCISKMFELHFRSDMESAFDLVYVKSPLG